MKVFRKATTATLLVIIASFRFCAAETIDFEDVTVFTHSGDTGSYFNGNRDGTSNASGWWSSDVYFGNSYSPDFGGFWSGWSYSTVQDGETADFTNQYAARPGSGVDGSTTYAVGFSGETLFFNLPQDHQAHSVQLTNTTYTYKTVAEGNQFSKKFGGASGDDHDFFSVVFTGMDSHNGEGESTGQIEIFLADYRFAEHDQDFVLNTWQQVDLTPLGEARSVKLSFTSSDVGEFGINTPQYVAIDNLEIVSMVQVGDFDGNGILDALDIDTLSAAVRVGDTNPRFDLNNDGAIEAGDRTVWINDLKGTYFGDANLDGEFNTRDLTEVFQAAEYEDSIPNNSTWAEGDWNGDGNFGTQDLVLAFQDGGYESGPRPPAQSVPEPGVLAFVLLAFMSLLVLRGEEACRK